MNKRLEFHDILCEIVNITEPDGDRHTYFQPPASVKMCYPAIRYSTKPIEAIHADNIIYRHLQSYDVILISKQIESDRVMKLLALPYCKHEAHYIADNLYHDKFTIYY